MNSIVCDKCEFKDGRIFPINLIDTKNNTFVHVKICVNCKNNWEFEICELSESNQTFERLIKLKEKLKYIVEYQLKGDCKYFFERFVIDQ